MQCPSCRNDLNFSAAQQEKINAALAALKEGQSLKLPCPHCRQTITLGATAPPAPRPKPLARKDDPAPPPPPPDLSWLASGDFEAQDVIEDIPYVLICSRDEQLRYTVSEAFAELGYQPVYADASEDAVARMRFDAFRAVVLDVAFEERQLADNGFHRHMSAMPMVKRRAIYYVVIGPGLHTLYDLEALTLSANLLVNERDLSHLNLILRKGLTDYEELFGPFIAALGDGGGR
ncbi:MAG: hypothetical protein AB1568_15525 [Thermodesulfobacteriota bacterium]